MNLSEAIVGHQNSLLQFYRNLEERFEENSIIRIFWGGMADDISQQIQCLKSLPPSLWNQFKNAPDNGFETAVKSVPSPPAEYVNLSLRDCFEMSLHLSDTIVLKIYARIVKLLRNNSTAPALNFYILVKTYLARILRTIESVSGEPALIHRAQSLIRSLEKEVQEPAPEIRVQAARSPSVKAQKTAAAGMANNKAAKETVKNPPQIAKAAKTASVKPEKSVESKTAKAAKAASVKPEKAVESKAVKAASVKPEKSVELKAAKTASVKPEKSVESKAASVKPKKAVESKAAKAASVKPAKTVESKRPSSR